MSKERLYWISQVSGWLFYILIILVYNKLQGKSIDLYFSLNLITIFALGISISHTYRLIIIKLDWLRFKIISLIPRVIISSIICGGVFFFAHTFISYTMILRGPIQIELNDAMQTTVNQSVNFMGWSLLYFLFHFIQNFRKVEIENLRWQALSNEVELNKLKSQLNPHFIFNSMNSIRALVDENPKRSKESITQLSNILRSSLLMGRKKVISLREELQLVHDYLNLEQTRFEERLKVNFSISEDALEHQIPPMLLQTLVENGIKHGISKLPEGGFINVEASITGEDLSITIVNSGIYTPSNGQNGQGFGLLNSRQRLQLLYGEKATLKIFNSSLNTVTSEVTIPNSIKKIDLDTVNFKQTES